MTCHDVRELFSALVDEALGADARAGLDAHLAACAECRRELQRFRDTVALLRATGPARAPAGFVDRVLEAARPLPWHRRLLRDLFVPWPVKLPMEAAALVLVAVGVVYVYRGTPELRQIARVEPVPPAATEAPRGVASEPTAPSSSRDTAQPRAATVPVPPEQVAPPAVGLRDAPQEADRQRQAERPAAAAPEPRIAAKAEAPPTTAEAPQATAKERTRSQALQAPESRVDPAAPARRPAAPSAGVASLVPADVSGRLVVSDRDSALRGLSELVTRLGAVEDRRIEAPEGPVIELTVPYEAYADFTRELARLGRWQPSREPAAFPTRVRVVLRITG